MIKLISVSDFGELNENIRQIYVDSFPVDERRDWDELKKLLEQPNFTFYQIMGDHGLIGFITIWDLQDFVFIEHFALEESARGKGIGSQVVTHLLESNSTRVVLEVDLAITEMNRRRINFYERLGFSACDSIYWQPAYGADKITVKMLLMSSPDKITSLEFDKVKTEIYSKVYQVGEINDLNR